MNLLRRLLIPGMLWLPLAAQAALDVVATSTSTGALVREVAGDHAKVTVLAPPDRDLHYLQARPTMMRALRSADLVVALGADMEVGWLPPAIRQAANPAILPGRAGYFEAAAQVERLDVGGPADRARGDVHPVGNPHVNMDPVRMARVALALADRLAELDPDHGGVYRERAAAFEDKVQARMEEWQRRTAGTPGVVSFHKDVVYLLDRFGVPHLGTLEPVPGVPPSASHLRELTDRLAGRDGVILYATYQPQQAADVLAQALGWSTMRLPLEPPMGADGEAYLDHMERWVDALATDG
ncbi:MAG: metal ABC transporter substrate-binding protein [Gammaproteobacteria bacterium]|nr:metal ABC transporter substrate-binding protein [Gammaproteobacteria bacterium]